MTNSELFFLLEVSSDFWRGEGGAEKRQTNVLT